MEGGMHPQWGFAAVTVLFKRIGTVTLWTFVIVFQDNYENIRILNFTFYFTIESKVWTRICRTKNPHIDTTKSNRIFKECDRPRGCSLQHAYFLLYNLLLHHPSVGWKILIRLHRSMRITSEVNWLGTAVLLYNDNCNNSESEKKETK